MCADGGIGYKGQLPWPHCKADMAHFAKRTTGAGNNAVIMGQKTWHSIPIRPLRRRANLILSSHAPSHELHANQEHWFSSISNLFAHLESAKYDEVWIIGGASIYEQFLKMHANNEIVIDEMCITKMKGTYECDTFFSLLHMNECEDESDAPCLNTTKEEEIALLGILQNERRNFVSNMVSAEIEDDDNIDEKEKLLVCFYCRRDEKECERDTKSEKNPITFWCGGWGMSCDDCYYDHHPETEDEDEDEEDDFPCKECRAWFDEGKDECKWCGYKFA